MLAELSAFLTRSLELSAFVRIDVGERHAGAGGSHSSADPEYARKRKDYIAKQQRWLLFLRHCAKCQSADNACQYGQSCAIAKQLWRHILTCSDGNCTYSRSERNPFYHGRYPCACRPLFHHEYTPWRAGPSCRPLSLPSLPHRLRASHMQANVCSTPQSHPAIRHHPRRRPWIIGKLAKCKVPLSGVM